ncbi:MAG: proline--tRNA ligase [Desulfobulbaceae bacterium A2]|nr:MAG: proline--tRNA ligase [Desulfobulbaceae bacterium A2]
MRCSRMLLPTMKENPAEAEVVSHRLLLRAGYIRKLASGIYNYLPLGLAALRKVERIVREEMNRAGAQEVLLPMVQPAELWQESGRWQKYGPELLRFTDRHEHECCLGPTHEEVITDLVRQEVHSYRQLPLNLYQIQTKFRDEIRPRFGLMRGREFVMKDAYSFDAGEQGAETTYRAMHEAYTRIFPRCGLRFRAVEADTGSIGGSFSHEFMVLAATGEDTLAVCRQCSYAANVEKAQVVPVAAAAVNAAAPPCSPVATPGMTSIEQVAAFLQKTPAELIKTMIYRVDGELVAVLLRGDRQVQEVKLKGLLGADEVALATDEEIRHKGTLPVGSLGPLGMPLKLVADQEVMAMAGAVTGANQEGCHLLDVVPGRDFVPVLCGDLRQVTTDDPCPLCGGTLELTEGIEVGHIFKLGTKYSEALKAEFQDADGVLRPIVMGCYGIGVSRVVAAAIEQNHDEHGIVFPLPIAPFQVSLLNLAMKDPAVGAACERLYGELQALGVEVLYDDRDERPGSKFKDADLIGLPYRLAVGKHFGESGQVELRRRRDGQQELLPATGAAVEIARRIAEELAGTGDR